jgi:hypothetical protein
MSIMMANRSVDGVLGEITQTDDVPVHWQAGFAPLSNASKPPCGAWPICTRERRYLHGPSICLLISGRVLHGA